MSKISLGIIFTTFGQSEYIAPSLENWIKTKKKYDIKIAAVSGKFKEMAEFDKTEDLITPDLLRNNKEIDFVYIQNPEKEGYQQEHQIMY